MENLPQENNLLVEQAKLLIQRLERISADSIWARRASGLRGALLHQVEICDNHSNKGVIEMTTVEVSSLQTLVSQGFWMLERAAEERLR